MIVGVWSQEKKAMSDDRNYSSLADEFDMAAGTADELICDDDNDDADVSTVRRRLTTNLADNV